MQERGDLVTTAHEVTHGVNADIRNAQPAGSKVNGFYLLRNQALVVPEPNFDKNQVAQFIPVALRGDRFNTYVAGMREWDDRPLYLWDEYTAYTNGAFCAAELKDKNEYQGDWSDWAMGPLEFSIYTLAVMAAAKRYDSSGYSAIKSDFATVWARGWQAHHAASRYFPWDKQDAYLAAAKQLSGPLADTLNDLGLSVPDSAPVPGPTPAPTPSGDDLLLI
jgi:hypothetical protein